MVSHPDLQRMQRFSSEVLWHFTGGFRRSEAVAYRNLVSILKSGLKTGPRRETVAFPSDDPACLEYEKCYRVACLTDIPLKDLQIHAERYGRYAVGFHKDRVAEQFNPVWYVHLASSPLRRVRKLSKDLKNRLGGLDESLAADFSELMTHIVSYMKTSDLKSPLRASASAEALRVNNYYYEREWRSTKDWNFRAEDVAVILMPRARLKDFTKIRGREKLRLTEEAAILPFELINSL